MPLVDIVLLMGAGVMAVAVAGWVGLRADRRRRHRDAEAKGQKNAAELRAAEARRCVECAREADPQVDVFDHGTWWCKPCWLKIHR